MKHGVDISATAPSSCRRCSLRRDSSVQKTNLLEIFDKTCLVLEPMAVSQNIKIS